MTPEHLKKLLKDILTQLQDAISRAEFTEAFKTVTSLVLDTERKVVSKADSAIKELKDTFDKARTDLEEGTLSDFASLKQSLSDAVSKALREQESGMNFIRDKARQITKGKEGERGPAGPPGKDGKDAIETPESVRDKLETLKDEERLDASAVKNLPQFVEQTGTKAGWGAHPLKILDDGVVIDKVARIINFTGGTVTRSRDGTINVAQGTTTTPGSPDTSVQFNDGGSFGGDSAFLWDKSNNILLLGLENLAGTIAGKDASSLDTSGAELALSGGNPNGAANGSGVTITGSNGGSTSGSGGSISLTAGSAQGGDSDGGGVTISAGASTGSGSTGTAQLRSASGNVFLQIADFAGEEFGIRTDGSDFVAYLDMSPLTANRTFTFPDRSGYLAVATQGADVGSANNLSLGADGNVFEITGTTQINLISNVGWTNGNTITLLFTSNPLVKHGQTTSTTNITILLAGAVDFASSAGDTLTLCLCEIGGTQAWREISRAVI